MRPMSSSAEMGKSASPFSAKRLLIVADECAELIEPGGLKTSEGKEEDAMKSEIVGLMKSVTQLGRSAGIHMVLAPLSLNTIVPTTTGFTTIGDIEEGTEVFSMNGMPVKTIGVSTVKKAKRMYSISLIDNDDRKAITVNCDHDHYFPVKVRGSVEKCSMERILALSQQGYNLKFLGYLGQEWNVHSIERMISEPVKCILVDSKSHQFLVTDRTSEEWNGGRRWNGCVPTITTYNTQRNDASIIPGVIQNNPLALDTKLPIRRKVD